MNLLLIGIDDKIKNVLINNLLPRGIPLYDCYYSDSVAEIIEKKEVDIVFIDIDKEGGLLKHLPVIQRIRSMNVAIITYSSSTDESGAKILIENGVTGFVKKTDKAINDIKSFLEILFKRAHAKEKRKALRVKIDEGESTKINFSVPNSNRTVNGSVVELSYIGVLFKLDQFSDTKNLKIGDTISNVSLQIGSKRAITDVQIVMMKGEYIGLKFTDYDDTLKSTLIKYIYQKMAKL
jgi:hypothetical protein